MNSDNAVCYLQTQQSAKSFSYASQYKQQVEHTERIQAAVAQQAQWQPATRIKYENVNQFTQKVELYRGRYVCIMNDSEEVNAVVVVHF